MRKAIAFILLLVISSHASLAEELDLRSLELKELVALGEQIREEIALRGIEGTAAGVLINGLYITGTDIRPGRYTLTCVFGEDDYAGWFGVYADKAKKDDGDPHDSGYLDVGEFTSIRLEDGAILQLNRGAYIIEVSELPFEP